MADYHNGPFGLEQGVKSIAYYSILRPRNLLVFVHGFGGSAITTWNDFPTILTSDQAFEQSDIIFYGYDSFKSQANNMGLRFYKFLKVHNYPQGKSLNNKRGVTANFTYDRIILVGHSLGSIVVRRALLNAKVNDEIWVNECKMVLFAPAHRGARIQGLLLECLPGISKVFAGLGLTIYPITDDLRPDSRAILNLISDTEQYINLGTGDFTIAHTVVWAGSEIVVYNERFCNDPVAEEIANKRHMGIQKPVSQVYEEPVAFVRAALNA